jgi:hypothetical protein
MPRTYKHGRSLFKAIARKLNVPVASVKHEFMRNVTEAAKLIIGPEGDYTGKWLSTLRELLPVAYSLLNKQGRVPSAYEILEAAGKRVAVATTA